jgi:hypothetical protein
MGYNHTLDELYELALVKSIGNTVFMPIDSLIKREKYNEIRIN